MKLTTEAGRAVTRRRRDRLGALRTAHDETGISVGTWQRIEGGKEFDYTSLVRVVQALGWNPATDAELLLQGGDPDHDVAATTPAEDEIPTPARIASIIIELPDGTKVVNISPDQIEAVMRGLQRLADGDPEEGQMAAKDTGLPEGKRVVRPSPDPEE